MKENIQKALIITLAMLMMVLVTWLIFRESDEEEINQVYLSEYLETEEHIPTLDEVVERHGVQASGDELAQAYSPAVADLFQQNLLPFEAELPTMENDSDLKAIKRVYYDDVVEGISPVKPNYIINGDNSFEVDHQRPHINVKSDALFVSDQGFQAVSDWLQAGYFQVYSQAENLDALEGLLKVTDDKNVSDLLNLVNSMEITVDDNHVSPLFDLINEEDLESNRSSYVPQEDLYRYQEAELDHQDFVQAHQTFGYLEPALYTYTDKDISPENVKLIDDTILPFKAYLNLENIDDSADLTLNNTSWTLESSEEDAVVVE